jgi:hypothetical protein
VFSWSYVDAAGRISGRSEEFATREAAEGWLAGAWADLDIEGVERVILVALESGEEVYRMDLGEG